MIKVQAAKGNMTKIVYFDDNVFVACCWAIDMIRSGYKVRVFEMIDSEWVDSAGWGWLG